MRITRFTLSFALSIALISPGMAQQTSASDSVKALTLLQGALGALSVSGASASDVTLSGTARYIQGSDDETGTAVLRATSDASRVDLNLSSGQRSEVRTTSNGYPLASGAGPDGVSRPIPLHNILTESAWFFPTFLVARGFSGAGFVTTYVGPDTKHSVAVEHLAISQTLSALRLSSDMIATSQRLTQIDLYLDATSLLPVAIDFNVHPNDNELVDIPVEIRFSDYRNVNGYNVPFHVERFLNNGLILSLQFQTVVLNSGLSASSFSM